MYKVPTIPQTPDLRFGADSKYPLNGGLCLNFHESALNYNQSPMLQNINADDKGSIIKRWGLDYKYVTSLGSSGINGIYDGLFKGKLIFAWGGNLYSQADNTQPIQIGTGLANAKTFFFVYNAILYIMDGTKYWQYDGTTFSEVVAYAPTLTMERKPDGSSATIGESWNMLGAGFKDSFNGDGISSVYQMSLKGLDSTVLTVDYGGVTYAESTDFTVDRTNGKVTFIQKGQVSGVYDLTVGTASISVDSITLLYNATADSTHWNNATTLVSLINADSTLGAKYTATVNGSLVRLTQKTGKENPTAPVVTTATIAIITVGVSGYPLTGVDNIVITAYKTNTSLANQIKQCTFAKEAYSVMFFSGNPNLPNYYFIMQVTDDIKANYFPQKRFYTLKGADKAITGFALHHGQLVIFKEDMIARVTAETSTVDGISATYPVDFINNVIGCDMPSTIATANNDIIFANTTGGVFILQAVINSYTNDKIAMPISGNVNGVPDRPGILQHNLTDLKNATAYAFKNKYYLCIKSECYVWDFDISYYYQGSTNQYNLTWWYYTNINAGHWFSINTILYFTNRDAGMISFFDNIQKDYGQPIEASWRSKLMDFEAPEWYKSVSLMTLMIKANTSSSVNIKYFGNPKGDVITKTIPSKKTRSFSWKNFSWDGFTWGVHRFSPIITERVSLNLIDYFQVEFSNSELNENLAIMSFTIKYTLKKLRR